MQAFTYLVKFGLVLIYMLKVYHKKSSSILLRKYMFNSLLTFFFWKVCPFSNFESLSKISCWKSRNYSQIYLSRIINYWNSILTLHITLGAFSLVCFLSVFFSFFLRFFYRYFPSQTLIIHKTGGAVEGIIIFLVFYFHPLTNIHLIYFYSIYL